MQEIGIRASTKGQEIGIGAGDYRDIQPVQMRGALSLNIHKLCEYHESVLKAMAGVYCSKNRLL